MTQPQAQAHTTCLRIFWKTLVLDYVQTIVFMKMANTERNEQNITKKKNPKIAAQFTMFLVSLDLEERLFTVWIQFSLSYTKFTWIIFLSFFFLLENTNHMRSMNAFQVAVFFFHSLIVQPFSTKPRAISTQFTL